MFQKLRSRTSEGCGSQYCEGNGFDGLAVSDRRLKT